MGISFYYCDIIFLKTFCYGNIGVRLKIWFAIIRVCLVYVSMVSVSMVFVHVRPLPWVPTWGYQDLVSTYTNIAKYFSKQMYYWLRNSLEYEHCFNVNGLCWFNDNVLILTMCKHLTISVKRHWCVWVHDILSVLSPTSDM